ncbi:RICIN domain-containing protein [Streptomyces sp. ISL-43]|uniref:RICIN domain-containing protein n=1 Tax=Streptomyces sp. ISL-43 TaxID=2819183 RepID=UPI001BEA48D3|nr:RICIN domain-containing protein [Streptomyces sp. ISL-43]MBT2453200.1 RICIN domain-containing protein [Streptomyces sp. ISL-43]
MSAPGIRPRRITGLLVTATAVTVGLITAAPAQALVGVDPSAGQHAAVAKLNVGDEATSRACTGVLVDPSWVLTAASCFAATPGTAVPAGKPALKTTVTVGRPDLTQSGGNVVEAVDLMPHADRDLVMVKLAWPVVGVAPVKIATTAPVAGEQLTSLGFGRTKTEWVPNKLHSAVFTVGSVDGTSVGLNGSESAVLCKGDAGAPALRIKGGSVELAAVNSRSWQGGCLGTDAAETRNSALDVRTDDLGAWIGQVRQITPAVRLQSLVPNVSKVMTTGDFNRDGRTDVAAVTTDGNLHTFAGRPDGTFEYGRPLWKADGSWNSAAKIIGGDFNGDGYADIASVWSNGVLRLYTGQSDGTLAAGKQMWVDDNFNWNGMLQLTRFKADNSGRDGLLAIWSAGNKGDLYSYATGPDGRLSGPSTKMWPDSSWQSMQKVVTGDFNNDGRDDVVTLAGDGQLLRFSRSASGGLDSSVAMWPDKSWNGMPIVLSGDFNGDGNTDLGALWSTQQRFNLYRGDGKGALAPGVNAWPSPTPLPAGGVIHNANSGKCLEIDGSSKANGGLAQQWTCAGQPGANWQFRPTATQGVYEIVNVNSGLCLEISNSSKDDGGRAQQWTCGGIPTQQWRIQPAGDTVFLNITNVNSGKTLEVSNSSKDNGAPVQQWAHSSDPSFAPQSWYL